MTDLSKYFLQAVPRYTSYPTAPHFSKDFDAGTYADWLAGLDPREPVSLYIHVPFCRELCWYCGCNMKLISHYAPVSDYVDVLQQELALLVRHLPDKMTIAHLHWGGGTPTSLEPDDLARVMDRVRANFKTADTAEIALETDPRTLTDDMIRTIARLGFNRVSLGVQEFDPGVQKAIHRIQPPEMVEDMLRGFRSVGIQAFNFDLMYGLPFQTVESLQKTITRVSEMRPDRISLFGYAHVPWKAKKQRLLPEEELPGAAERVAQAQAAADFLVESGYEAIGLDHFALPDDPLAKAARAGTLRRNFQGYTTDISDTLLGCGVSSIGRTPKGYVQNIMGTSAWTQSVEAGQLPVEKGLVFSEEDLVRGQIIEQLMCFGTVDLKAVRMKYCLPENKFGPEYEMLDQYISDGLVELDQERLTLTEAGRPLMRTVAAVFDTYFAENASRHSVAV